MTEAPPNTPPEAPLVPAGPVRPLGVIERAFEIFNEKGLLTPVVVAHLQGRVPLDALQQAAIWVQTRHPMLQMRILHDEAGTPFFHRGAPQVQVGFRVEPHHLWTTAGDDAVHRSFNSPEGPLWTVDLVYPTEEQRDTCVIVLAFHHAIEDGGTASLVLTELLAYARSVHHGAPLPLPETHPMLPPVEALTGARLSFARKLLVLLFAIARIVKIARAPDLILEAPDTPFADRRSHLVCLDLDRDTTSALLARCREHGTTMHGAFCAAMMLTGAPRVQGRKVVKLQCDTSISIRNDCKPPVADNRVGLYFSTVSRVFTIRPDTGFWELATRARREIAERIAKQDPIHNPLLLNWVKPDLLRAHMTHAPGRQQALFISNLGRYAYPDDKAELYRLESFYCASGQHGSGACFWLGAATVNGVLNLSFVYVHPHLSHATAQAMAAEVVDRLRRAAGPPQLPA